MLFLLSACLLCRRRVLTIEPPQQHYEYEIFLVALRWCCWLLSGAQTPLFRARHHHVNRTIPLLDDDDCDYLASP